jgi:hypothetical protein
MFSLLKAKKDKTSSCLDYQLDYTLKKPLWQICQLPGPMG